MNLPREEQLGGFRNLNDKFESQFIPPSKLHELIKIPLIL